MKFAVLVCPGCRTAWTVELRHASASCPRCSQGVEIAARKRLWEGDDVAGAQAAIAMHAGGSAAMAQVQRPAARAAALPHDSPTMAAATRGTGIVNRSDRADAVCRALLEMAATARHEDLARALQESGLSSARAEAEITRMLATDHLMEPRPGRYALVGH